jgi:alkanesulfonate monooxygenase SsuD/methylene tetrahydromethanopterin reductase-like flavin-dependent oxidoreductase (luciferase family)
VIELGVCVAAKIDEAASYARLAEDLGYASMWVADSQMLWSDCYATLALVAQATSSLRVGTGVAVAGTRPAAVTAASIATINRLAPGRTFLGIGTGNTAMRLMGHKPMTIAAFDAHLAELTPLLRASGPRSPSAARTLRSSTSCPRPGSSRSTRRSPCTSPPSGHAPPRSRERAVTAS